ncbi:hypothetical protein [Roseimaritima sediminicola]|uniref:hypothetical protein n=1 Tax=Roseimaritima sediminicola TaxID=2662066 RepID=UPI001298573A|nr:hypothetical protein [Roseimaritima sediminicola]
MSIPILLTVGLGVLAAGPWMARAQGPIDPAPAAPPAVKVTAVAGEPFGVARVQLPLSLSEFLVSGREISVTDVQGRVQYPVSRNIVPEAGPARPDESIIDRGARRRRALRRLEMALQNLTTPPEQRATGREVYFLFRGRQPFAVQFSGATELALEVRPTAAADQHRMLLDGWWQAYGETAVHAIENASYPPFVETYLLSMLSRRLDLPYPQAAENALAEREQQWSSVLEMIGGTERLRATLLEQAAARVSATQALASLPLPEPPAWQDGPPIDLPEEVIVEETARHVPPECFYLRFGSIENYLWFTDLSRLYGGDITAMVSLRGVNQGGTRRVEDQLAMKLTEVSRLLGATVVEDQAIVGTDLFLSEGASLGVLIKSKNNFLLDASLRNERSGRARAESDATLEDVEIAGRSVSLLSTPDNRLRSFLAVHGSYFLVSNSRHLVERFFAVADGAPSLGETREFQLARRLMPVDRQDTLFAYFSPGMLRNLVGPKYQIELRRRLVSHADISLLRLAALTAAGEGRPLESIEDLMAAGYLPRGFGLRPDGSGPLRQQDRVVDSLRGSRGSFLPIADVAIDSVTEEEAAWYRRRADYFSEHWKQFDPIMVGIGRNDIEGGMERLTIHAEVAPLVPEKYGTLARQLGPPTRASIRFAPDDIVSVQAHVESPELGGTIPPHHLFAAIKDAHPPEPEQFSGVLRTYMALRALPGYLGAWPQPGLLDRLPLGLGQGVLVEPGLTRLLGGLYRFQGGDFSVLSFQPEVLANSLPEIAVVQSDDEAQVRLHVGNLVGSQLEGWVNDQLYQQAAELSQAGAAFLDRLSEQLKLDEASALAASEQLLDARLVCPLGGEYERRETPRGRRWVSTAWDSTAAAPHRHAPPDYTAPVLKWFRGADANLTQYEDRLVIDAAIDTQHERPGPAKPRTRSDSTTIRKADF